MTMRCILRDIGFRFKLRKDGRKYLMGRLDIATATAHVDFVKKNNQIQSLSDERQMVYLDETWMNQNHSITHT